MISSIESGLNSKTRLRLTERVIHGEKWIGGRYADEHDDSLFDVGQKASCWARLKRWISSMNSSVLLPSAFSRSRASSNSFAEVLHAAGDRAELAEDDCCFR